MNTAGGQHFLQTPGPSNVPDRILRALARPTIDHRGPEFGELTLKLLPQLQRVFKTEQPVIVYPSSGTGAWEAALTNCLSPGDRVLAFETGHFATLWRQMAVALGLEVEFVPGDWRHGVDPDAVEQRLRADTAHQIAAVTVVHNETSTGVTSRVGEIRAALDRAGHPALLLVDTISSLASIDFAFDEWRVDVAVGCSQKGLMLPPGLGLNAVSARALAASARASLPRSYWRWQPVLDANQRGFYPYTPATNLLFGLSEALDMIEEEGLDRVFARHARLAEATRAAVTAWGLEVVCADPREYSASVTGVLVPDHVDAAGVNRVILERYNMSLGIGLGKLAGRAFRIGHLGHLNELSLAGTLSGVELGLQAAGVPIKRGGVDEALAVLGRPPV
jgi:alanine-glyoxylate transaminase / serine-glyoxylate transaminase / serine-pyruvate transaminase